MRWLCAAVLVGASSFVFADGYSGGGGGSGGVTSLSTSCPAQAGQPLNGAVTLPFGIGPVARNPVAGTSDAIVTGDCGQTIEYTSGSSIAVTVPQAGTTGFLSGFVVSVTMKSGSGTATFTTTTSVFSSTNAVTFTLIAGQSATLQSDGTNWNVYSGVSTNTVTGPASAVTTDIATFNGTTGKVVQDSGKTIAQATANLLGFPGYINTAGTFYTNPYMGANAASTSSVGVQFSFYCSPYWIYQPVSVEGLIVRVIGTSAGNFLAGALYNDLLTTGNVHRPGTLIDFTSTAFVTTSAAAVVAALGNGHDAIATAGMYWTCLQKGDATATYGGFPQTSFNISQAIGTQTIANSVGSATLGGVSTTGTGFNGANWINFTSSTTWTEIISNNLGPNMGIEIFSVP